MDHTEKNMLIGAFATAGVKMGLESWFSYNAGAGTLPPTEMFPYMTVFSPMLPPLDVWIADAGVPALLYGLGKLMKKPALVQMAKGGAIYGVGELAGITMYRVAAQTQASTRYVMTGRRL